MEKFNRCERRASFATKLARSKKIVVIHDRYLKLKNSPSGLNLRAKLMVDNMAKCSCTMCGNPRKWFNQISLQELKSALDDRELDLSKITEDGD